eukprot:6480804-Pyramimonas_sp.AAC.1
MRRRRGEEKQETRGQSLQNEDPTPQDGCEKQFQPQPGPTGSPRRGRVFWLGVGASTFGRAIFFK